MLSRCGVSRYVIGCGSYVDGGEGGSKISVYAGLLGGIHPFDLRYCLRGEVKWMAGSGRCAGEGACC